MPAQSVMPANAGIQWLAAALLFASTPALAVDPLHLPPEIPFPEFVDSIQVSGALVKALTVRKWTVEKDTGESVTAYKTQRALRLHLRIDYDNHHVSFHYLDSDNFHGEDDPRTGGILIHRKANVWLQALGEEVGLQMQPILFARDPAEIVPVTPSTDMAPVPAPVAPVPAPVAPVPAPAPEAPPESPPQAPAPPR